MKQRLGFVECLLLLVTPSISSCVLVNAPSQAASFAFSQGVLEFTRFSQSPTGSVTNAGTNTFVLAREGIAIALTNAQATFITVPPTASNLSLSRAFGEGIDIIAQAQSQSRVIGNFLVDAGTLFSFDFTANFNLGTSIEPPLLRTTAFATGDIFFLLLDTDTQSLIDLFSLQGNISFPDDNDFIAYYKSENVAIGNPVTTFQFGGPEEFVNVSVEGSVQRSFANRTNLTLVEVKRNKARVVIPEPSITLALLFVSATVGVALKGKREEKTQPAC